ncbi:MAG: T9SS type A sorting domain-containing protein [Flavobacterium sp.]
MVIQVLDESRFNGVHFFDTNVGLTIGNPTGSGANKRFEVYRTTDGGDTWTKLTAAALTPLSNEYGYSNGFVAVGDVFWFTTSKGRLIKSIDRGITWNASNSPTADFGGYTVPGTSATVHFSNTSTGYLLKTVITGASPNYVYTRTFYTTIDGGQSWSAGTAFTGTRFILNYIPGTTTIVATSLTAPIGTSISTNNGTSWTDVETADQRGAAAFLNGSIGWCAGFSESPTVGGIYKLSAPLAVSGTTAAKFKIYPNPANAIITIATPDVETAKLSVTDISGKTVMITSLNGMENNVDISSLSNGVYFFEINASSKKEVVKFIKN